MKCLLKGHIDGSGRRRATTDRGCSLAGPGLPVTAQHADCRTSSDRLHMGVRCGGLTCPGDAAMAPWGRCTDSFEEIVEEYLGWFRQVHPTVRFDRVMVTESVPGQTVGLEGVPPAEFAPRFEQLVEWIDSDWINLAALTVVEGGTLLLGVEYRGPKGKKSLSREQIRSTSLA